MIRRPPRSTRTDTRFPYTTLFRSVLPTAAIADEILTPGEGQVRAFVTMAGNPVLSHPNGGRLQRSEEHTSELQSLMRISYAVFCLNKKNNTRLKQSKAHHIRDQ